MKRPCLINLTPPPPPVFLVLRLGRWVVPLEIIRLEWQRTLSETTVRRLCTKNGVVQFSFHKFSEKLSNNFRWLNAVKETKIEFFVRDNSGEKFLTAHATRRNFSEVICRACAVVVYSWFSHLHGKFCVLVLRTFFCIQPWSVFSCIPHLTPVVSSRNKFVDPHAQRPPAHQLRLPKAMNLRLRPVHDPRGPAELDGASSEICLTFCRLWPQIAKTRS